jgi:hypothetical protein
MILINLFLSPLPRLKFDLIFTTGRRLWQHAGAASRLNFATAISETDLSSLKKSLCVSAP